jgi:proline iminopeptidase
MSDALFPPLEPYASGWLPVGDGHRVWYEQCGNPNGMPVVFLHGGPGSSINANHRRFFDPAFYRIVLFDQRGCGRSTPLGETRGNTTQDLVADMEQLRLTLAIGRWMLFGGSWGSTLALAYAQAHRAAVAGLVLRGVFLASIEEVDWFLTGLRRFLPEAWERFVAGAEDLSAAGLLNFYNQRAAANDEAAAHRWTAWESAVISVGEATASSTQTDSSALPRVRVQLHYLLNGCFLAPAQLLEGLQRLGGVPAIIVQGRRDLVCPPATAYTLTQRWPSARLRMVEEGGHSAMHPAIARALVHATQDMKEGLTAP